MDLNQLYSDHQVLLVKANRAVTLNCRAALLSAASQVAQRIGGVQRTLGAPAAQAWDALAATSQAAAPSCREGYAF